MTTRLRNATTCTAFEAPRRSGCHAGIIALALAVAGCGDPVKPGPEPPEVSPDRGALVAIYNATGGPNWRLNTNWLTDAPVGEWHGVTTDDAGRVQRLVLSTNQLAGIIPAAIGRLPHLRFLGLASNGLTGRIPARLGAAVQLDSLFLNNNELSGPIPHTLLQLEQLSAFDFSENEGLCVPANAAFGEWGSGLSRLDGPDCAEGDTEVLRLFHEATGGANWADSHQWLSDALLSDWFGVDTDSIGQVTALDLPENGLSGTVPESLGRLTALTRLDVTGNDLEGRLPQSLTKLAIRHIRYSGTRLCAPRNEVFQRWLGLIGTHEGTGIACPLSSREILTILYETTGGEGWDIDHNWLTELPLRQWAGVATDRDGQVIRLTLPFNGLLGTLPPEIGHLSSLRDLDLRGNWGLTGPLPDGFFELSSLETLRLTRVGLGGPLTPAIGRLTSLRELELNSTGLGGPLPPEIGNLAQLEVLDLSANDLVGRIPPEIGNLTRLEVLETWNNDFSGEIPSELGNLAELKLLDMETSGLTGGIPATLGNLRKLRTLWLNDNELTGPIPAAMGGMARVRQIFLHGNSLEGSLPEGIGRLSELEDLWLGGNAGLAGPLPLDLAELGRLSTFKAGGTDLCAPADPALREWLEGVRSQRVAHCGAPAAYLTQAVQSRRFPVPLIANQPALLRVFVSSPRAAGEPMPKVRATFYHGGAEVHAVEIRGGSVPIPAAVDEGSLSGSANADIPGEVLRPGLEMVVEIDPEGVLDAALGVSRRLPETGRTALNVRELPAFPLTLVPFLYAPNPDRSILELAAGMAEDPEGHDLLRHTRELLPIDAFDIALHAPVTTYAVSGFSVLQQVELIRRMESEGPGYWLGLQGPVPVSGLLGVALGIPSWSSFSVPLSNTIAHELGHNLGLWHAPCGGAGGPDPLFPDTNGRIGSWGYDRAAGRLVSPYVPDIMSYCPSEWIGDYHFSNALRHRLGTELEAASVEGRTRSLMVWGGRGADGEPYLEPAFIVDALPAVPGPGREYRLVGRSETGEEAFSFTFDMPYIPEVEGAESGFVFAIPVTWSGDLASISLADGRESAVLDTGTDSPLTILRDPVTGEVRAILRATPAGAMSVAGDPGLRAVFSRGIPDPEERR